MKIIQIIVTLLILILAAHSFSSNSNACTLWSASGQQWVEGGGSLIVKNRDWKPDHRQELKLVAPNVNSKTSKFRYLGLFATDGGIPGLKAGINEAGLVVIVATASSIPAKEKMGQPFNMTLLESLLSTSESVDEALTKHNDLFIGPQYLLLADKNKTAVVEIVFDGNYSVKIEANGVLYHTNHYLDKIYSEYNKITSDSSLVRSERIYSLLTQSPIPFSINDFINFSNDQHDGNDNSIWRIGKDEISTRTLATWIVKIPQTGSPILYLKILNPKIPNKTFSESFNVNDFFDGKISVDSINKLI